ncbi:MAG: NAD(P)-dependent oxidoreductase [Oscillospiraceae bacterium]|nr:NAD(P)-dependent oxidoreductase [Oscillospiraceae bacterium]
MSKVAWIGVGLMGSCMAPRVMAAGHEMTVCDTVREHCDDIVSKGAKFVATPAEAAAEAQYIFSIIPNSNVLRAIVKGENGLVNTLAPGKVFIDMSTVDMEASAEVAEAIAATGAEYVRITVSGSVGSAREGKLVIMASGKKEVYEEVTPILDLLGDRKYYLGQKEEARAMKLIVNMLLASTINAWTESLVLGEALGVDWDTMLEVLADSSAANLMMKQKKAPMQKRDFSPMFTGNNMAKDLGMVNDMLRKNHLTLPVAAITAQMYSAMETHGAGELDYGAVLLVNEALNNIHHEK